MNKLLLFLIILLGILITIEVIRHIEAFYNNNMWPFMVSSYKQGWRPWELHNSLFIIIETFLIIVLLFIYKIIPTKK